MLSTVPACFLVFFTLSVLSSFGIREPLLHCGFSEEKYLFERPLLGSSLGVLLVKRLMLLMGIVVVLIVDMHECPFDGAQTLELSLQLLGNVVCHSEG